MIKQITMMDTLKNKFCKLNEIFSSITLSNDAHIFFKDAYVKEAIRYLNKNTSFRSDKTTPELIQNREKALITCVTNLLQDCYLLGYFPERWKQGNRIYIKQPDKDNYHIPNSYNPISFFNIMDKIYENILLQEAVNILTKSKFFNGKIISAYQKTKNAPQALRPLTHQMSEAIASGKYGVLVMANLEGAFAAVWRNGAIHKLHKTGIKNNFLSIFSRFLNYRILET